MLMFNENFQRYFICFGLWHCQFQGMWDVEADHWADTGRSPTAQAVPTTPEMERIDKQFQLWCQFFQGILYC